MAPYKIERFFLSNSLFVALQGRIPLRVYLPVFILREHPRVTTRQENNSLDPLSNKDCRHVSDIQVSAISYIGLVLKIQM